MTPQQQNHERWTKEAVRIGATHVIDVCDTFDHDNYPVYVMPGQDVNEVKDKYNGKSMQRVEGLIEVPVADIPSAINEVEINPSTDESRPANNPVLG